MVSSTYPLRTRIMEPALRDGADPMDWTVQEAASIPSTVDFLDQFPAVGWNTFPFQQTQLHTIPTAYSLSPFTTTPLELQVDLAAQAQPFMWANWEQIKNAINFDSTLNKTSEILPGYGSPSRALSIGSGHLSICSGASSNHSWSSWRGRSRIKKVFSRTSSIAGRAKNAMKEGMSSWSLNGAKEHVSPSPRRTGKLTDVARAGMRLLKGQGACWKCKILEKSVGNFVFGHLSIRLIILV